MNIVLPPAQQQWLEAQIAKGEFASIEDTVQRMIAERMALGADDLAWAKPYVDETLAAVANGAVMGLEVTGLEVMGQEVMGQEVMGQEVMGLEEHRARMARRLKALER